MPYSKRIPKKMKETISFPDEEYETITIGGEQIKIKKRNKKITMIKS